MYNCVIQSYSHYVCFINNKNVFQCNVLIFENKRRTGYDINIAKENYLVAPFQMVRLMNETRIWNLVKHLLGDVFAKIENSYKPLTIFAKKLNRRCSTWF